MRSKRVLLAEDNREVRRLLEIVLTTGGFEVTECKDGAEALAAVPTLRPDALVTDITMPGVDGLELVEAARRVAGCENLPVLVVTASDRRDSKVQALSALHRVEVVQKPPNWKEIVPALERLMAA